MKKYKTDFSGDSIEEYEAIKETPTQIVYLYPGFGGERFSERREAKSSRYGSWFDTWSEAHNHLISTAKQNIHIAEQRLSHEKEKMAKILSLPIREQETNK